LDAERGFQALNRETTRILLKKKPFSVLKNRAAGILSYCPVRFFAVQH
jgi:hypothetical protein